MAIKRIFETAYRRMGQGWNFASANTGIGPSRIGRMTRNSSRNRKGVPVVCRRIRIRKAQTGTSSPSVPKLPPAGPAVLPKPLKPVPPIASPSPKAPPPSSSSSSSSSAGGAATAASAGVSKGAATSSSNNTLAWLRINGPIVLLNFGSLCTLFGFTRTDVLELRIGNVIGNMCGMTYFGINQLWPPLSWASVFGLTNAYNIYLILEERSDRVVLSRDEQTIYEEHFLPHGLTPRQFARLMECSAVVHVPKGHVIVRQGDAQNSVSLVCSGRTRASIMGRRLTYASSLPGNAVRQKGGDSGAWVGEIAFLEAFWKREQLQRRITRPVSPAVATNVKQDGSSNSAEVDTNGNGGSGGSGVRENTGNHVTERDNGKAMHTILAVDDCTLRTWSHEDLEEVMKMSTDMRAAMTRSMTAALVGKVVNFTVSRGHEDQADPQKQTWSNWLVDEEGRMQAGTSGTSVTVTRQDTSTKKGTTTGKDERSLAAVQQQGGSGRNIGSGARGAVTRQDAIDAFREVLSSC